MAETEKPQLMEINLIDDSQSSQEEPPASPMQISDGERHPDKPKTTLPTAGHHNTLEVPMMSDSSSSSSTTTTPASTSLKSSGNNSPRRNKAPAPSAGHRRKPSKGLKPTSPRDLQLKKVLKMAKQKAVDDYEIGKTLGEGRYGKVKMGYHLKTGMKVAVKILTKSNIKNEEDLLRIQRETKILTSLHHDNIIRVYDVYETPLQIYIIMEFAEGGDLYTHLVTQRTSALPIEEALPYFRQIVSAMLYCHARFVVHRDLKPENLLLDKGLKNLKIADFGFSRTFSPEYDGLQTSCGSLYYAAPEILEGKKYIGPEVDVWSLGVILFVMLTGEMPFEGGNDHELARNIKRGNIRQEPLLSCDPVHGAALAKLVNTMLTVDPAKRAKLVDIQLNPTTWLDKPLLASLVLPFARKLAYTRKQSQQPDEQILAPLSQVVTIRNSATKIPSASSPALQRSFSATIGPSPFVPRANPPVTSAPMPQPVHHLKPPKAGDRRKLLRQTSGPLGSSDKMVMRTSGGGIPTLNPHSNNYPTSVIDKSAPSPPQLKAVPPSGDIEAGRISPEEKDKEKGKEKVEEEEERRVSLKKKRAGPLRTATAGFTLPADTIPFDPKDLNSSSTGVTAVPINPSNISSLNSSIPTSSSPSSSSSSTSTTTATRTRSSTVAEPEQYYNQQRPHSVAIPMITTTTATPPPRREGSEKTLKPVATSPSHPPPSRTASQNSGGGLFRRSPRSPRDSEKSTSGGGDPSTTVHHENFVERLHLDKLKDFLPDFGFITRKRSSTIT